ncbi:MAG: hypothetical protein PHS04_17980 [Tissierellia bacterium]|nr:hypothetical protein [Tissierellia bacterium]
MKTKNLTKIIIGTIIVLALGIYWWQSTSYSKEVLRLEILGPSEVAVGENIEYVVRLKNNGNIRLEEPELIFEYPSGAITDNEDIVIYDSEKLGGNIYPGEERTFSFSARLLGEEGALKIAKANLSFKPKDLNTRNEVNTEFLTTIKTVPINLDFNLPSKITSIDKAFSFSINYASEVDYSLQDLSIIIDYPEDFEFLYSNPKALDEKQWDITSLNKYESGKIDISGMKTNDNQSAFTVKLGIWDNNEFVVLKEITEWLQVVSSSLYINQKVNNSYDYIAKKGDSLHFEISFRNIGEEPLQDLILVSKLDGNLFDLNTVNAPSAKYTSGDNSLLFESKSFPDLEFLDVDGVGTIEFWVDLKSDLSQSILSQSSQKVKNIVSVGGAKEEFVTKVETDLVAWQHVDEGSTSGPYPLQINRATKVTVTWEALSSFNDVGEVTMRAIIPENGTLIKDDSFEEKGLTFNEETSELIWEIGSIPAGSGYSKDSVKVSFQILVSPQIATPGGVLLISSAYIGGKDEWTQTKIEYKTEELKGEIVGGNIAE